VDAYRVHRRRLRRHHQHVGVPGGGRRDPVHRVQLKKDRPAGARAVGGPPHPRPQPHPGHRQATLFDTWSFDAFFTTSTLDTVTADTTHRQHAIIEQVHADLKTSALAHLPSSRFAANGAWLVLATMAFNLTRAAATIIG